jgi:hypothetical protein
MTITGGWLTVHPYHRQLCYVEEGGKGEYFREGIYNDFEERFMGDTVELVG